MTDEELAANDQPWEGGDDYTGNVWQGDRIIGSFDDPDDAARAVAAHSAMPALVAKVERLKAMLRRVQWSSTYFGIDNSCPICFCGPPVEGSTLGGHERDCALAALLAGE